MTINEFLREKKFSSTKAVPNGKASTPEELYNNCITVPYPNDKSDPKTEMINRAIIGWHKLLSWYAVQDGAVLLSRLYESQKTDAVWDNRRNALTLSENYSYAFCSNHFARIIMTMALNGFVPSKQDFWDTMVTKRDFYLSSSHGLTGIEKRISAYSRKLYSDKCYTPGWYLAHIISVNDMPYKNSSSIDTRSIFKLGKESDWGFDAAMGCTVRKNNDRLTDPQKAVAVAHFLRCVDPINYFLVPNQNNVIYQKVHSNDGSPLGENKFVVEYMTIKAYERFGAEFEDFLNKALADLDIAKICSGKAKVSTAPINATYGIDINAGASSKKCGYDDEELMVAAYYLRNHSSLIKVEEVVLNVSNKKGFIAMKILNKLGIDTSAMSPHRGLLATTDINTAINSATGTFKATLEEILKRGL